MTMTPKAQAAPPKIIAKLIRALRPFARMADLEDGDGDSLIYGILSSRGCADITVKDLRRAKRAIKAAGEKP